jgi:hypothetical protein
MANDHKVDIIHIESKLNLAVQPFGIARTSVHKYLVRRLFERIASSKDKFEKAGFNFRLGEPAVEKATSTDGKEKQSGKESGK